VHIDCVYNTTRCCWLYRHRTVLYSACGYESIRDFFKRRFKLHSCKPVIWSTDKSHWHLSECLHVIIGYKYCRYLREVGCQELSCSTNEDYCLIDCYSASSKSADFVVEWCKSLTRELICHFVCYRLYECYTRQWHIGWWAWQFILIDILLDIWRNIIHCAGDTCNATVCWNDHYVLTYIYSIFIE